MASVRVSILAPMILRGRRFLCVSGGLSRVTLVNFAVTRGDPEHVAHRVKDGRVIAAGVVLAVKTGGLRVMASVTGVT